MAVQAQYPSNVLFLNRALQEGKAQFGNDYSLLSQPGGEFSFLDQSHMMIFNNNGGGGAGSNPRKRGREIAPTTSTMSPFSLQSQPLQLVDLTKLHIPQLNAVSTGLGLAFGQNQQIQPPPQQQQQSLSRQSSVLLSLLPDELANQIRQQGDEIDQFVQAQGEQLRRTLADKRQRHYRALLGVAEESLSRRLREKEVEVEKAARRHAVLESRAAQLSAEAQVWQARARAQEATAASLQEQLQQAIMSGGGSGARQQVVRGEELGCAGAVGQAEDAESGYIDPDRIVAASEPSCKACGRGVASVLLLPCRHLCLCAGCSGLARSCPLCLTYKDSSIEVSFS